MHKLYPGGKYRVSHATVNSVNMLVNIGPPYTRSKDVAKREQTRDAWTPRENWRNLFMVFCAFVLPLLVVEEAPKLHRPLRGFGTRGFVFTNLKAII